MKRMIISLIVLFILVFIGSGPGAVIEGVKNLLSVIFAWFGLLLKIAFTFPDELGITDFAYTWVICLIIFLLSAGFGIYLTKNQKSKIFSVISYIVAAISLILGLASFQ